MLPAELVGLDVSAWFRSGADRPRPPARRALRHAGDQRAGARRPRHRDLAQRREGDAADRPPERRRRGGAAQPLARHRARRARRRARSSSSSCATATCRPGDVLVTSGLGGVYPKGLRIGEVTEVSALRLEDAAARPRVRPAVDFGRLEQVFVMLRRGPTMELLYATDEGDSAEPPSPRRKPRREARRRDRAARALRARCSRARWRSSCPPAGSPTGAAAGDRARPRLAGRARGGAAARRLGAASSSDLLSGSLLGQHALICAAARSARRAWSASTSTCTARRPQMALAAALTAGSALALGGADRLLLARGGSAASPAASPCCDTRR